MHIQELDNWQHGHDFSLIHEKGQRRAWQVLALTVITMAAEIIAGTLFGSMALLADGWHMGTHAAAFAITILAYRYSKKHATDKRFTFGTGKVSVLGGFASAVVLGIVAMLMAIESIMRLFDPQTIHFNEAIAVAVLGLSVNLICAFLLYGPHSNGHNREHHDDRHDDTHGHHYHADYNIRGAYLHVIADALTSVLAIVALLFGKYSGWHWLDPVIGLVGALVITRWAAGLLSETSAILLDNNIDLKRRQEIKNVIESDSDNRVSDIHIWKVGPAAYAAMISIVTRFPKNPEYYKKLLCAFPELSHMTVEVNNCDEAPCIVPDAKTADRR